MRTRIRTRTIFGVTGERELARHLSRERAQNNLTGLSTYLFGNLEQPIPETRVLVGNSEQADPTASITYLGSGTP